METDKVQKEVYFYFMTGIILYITTCILNVIHLYQWKGREPVDFFFHLVLLSINISLIAQVKDLKNWARNIFLVKFILLLLAFYPQTLFAERGSWVYSGHWPHGVFQRISNISTFVYEIFFVLYLSKRSVRFVFVHRNDK